MTVRTRPNVRNTEDVWCWMNTWGDLDAHDFTREEVRGYRAAISDLLCVLREAGVTASDDAWERWTSGQDPVA